MSDFQVGDVVVCVDAGPAFGPLSGWIKVPLAVGRYYTVIHIASEVDYEGEYGVQVAGIGVEELPDFHPCFQARRFRKIDAADEQFTQQMRSLKPVKVSSNV